MSKTLLKPVCVKLSPLDWQWVTACADRQGCSAAAVVRALIRAYLNPALLGARLQKSFPGAAAKEGEEVVQSVFPQE